MAKVRIIVNPSESRKSLAMISVGQGAVLDAKVVGLPTDVSNVQIHFQNKVGSPYYTYSTEALANGEWSVVVPGTAFGSVGDILYHITALDDGGHGTWYGTGKCRIMPAVANVKGGSDDPVVPPSADNSWVKNRKTGLWHKLEIDEDEEGNILPVFSKEGYAR